MPDCHLQASGWRVILQSVSSLPHIREVSGLAGDFVRATSFDPVAVLSELRWPVNLLRQSNPAAAILQFCRELCRGMYTGDPVASLVLLGPGGTGKSTLLHRLQTHMWKPDIISTDGLCIGMSCHHSAQEHVLCESEWS